MSKRILVIEDTENNDVFLMIYSPMPVSRYWRLLMGKGSCNGSGEPT